MLISSRKDTSKMTESESEKASAGSIRATIETEIRKVDDHTQYCGPLDAVDLNRVELVPKHPGSRTDLCFRHFLHDRKRK
jgi:hypothetical protein